MERFLPYTQSESRGRQLYYLSFDESGGELSFEFDDPDTLIGENGSDKPAKRISDNPYDEMPRRIILPLGEDYSGDDMAVSLESVEWKESFEIRSRKHDYALNSEDDVPGESYLLVQGEMESRFPSSVHLGSDAYAAILINNKYFYSCKYFKWRSRLHRTVVEGKIWQYIVPCRKKLKLVLGKRRSLSFFRRCTGEMSQLCNAIDLMVCAWFDEASKLAAALRHLE